MEYYIAMFQELRPEASEPNDLFGWSLVGWKDQIIVGSPGKITNLHKHYQTV